MAPLRCKFSKQSSHPNYHQNTIKLVIISFSFVFPFFIEIKKTSNHSFSKLQRKLLFLTVEYSNDYFYNLNRYVIELET